MSNIMQYVSDEKTSEFYPTPGYLVEKMLSGINWNFIETILEPSAGKGDILRMIAPYEKRSEYRGSERIFDVDCIEIDPNLRQILNYNFGARKDELKRERASISGKYKYMEHRYSKGWIYYNEGKGDYVPVPEDDIEKIKEIDSEYNHFFAKGIHVVHDDFLTYAPYKQYDLIIMNPPFSNGDKHLLKALKMQERGGTIICLLNAETIRNPYTETRRELVRQLNKYNAQIEYIEDAFRSAERKATVDIALIKVFIEHQQEESDIYNHFKKAENIEDFQPENTEIEVSDFIKAAVSHYNVEVKAGIELIRQYRALVPYMMDSLKDSKYSSPILRLTDSSDRGYDSVSVNDYLKKVRLKYWEMLLSNPKFTEKLTSKLQKEYRERVNNLANYDFSEFNIYSLLAEMNTQIKRGIEDEIVAMFDRLTEEHHWHPETQKNRHYYDGWSTNKAHKIGKKVIIPCHGIFDSWWNKPRTYEARSVLEDIERVLNFLDGHMTAEIDSWNVLESHFENNSTKNVPLKYFNATFYKKGTIHLTFTCPELIERFNIYAAQNRGWLPPSYGKKAYKSMDDKERAVVDSFQGEAAYNKVIEKAGYYLAPVTNTQMLLGSAG